MQHLLIRNARLATGVSDESLCNILMADGRILAIGSDLQYPLNSTNDYDAQGRYVIPSLISLCNPRPQRIDTDTLKMLNFENIASGITSIMTVSSDIEDNIREFSSISCPILNYTYHIPLRNVSTVEMNRMRKLMVCNGSATAIVRFGDERRSDVASLSSHIVATRSLGLRVVYDFRGLIDEAERISKLFDLCELLGCDNTNKAFILGVENEEELIIIKELRGQCDVSAQLCYDPFGQGDSHLTKLSAQSIYDNLHDNSWCSYGLAYSVSKALKEGWPDLTPEIVGRNMIPLMNSLPADTPLTVFELVEYAISRPASYVGLYPMLGSVAEGSSANLIVWDANHREEASVDTPRGNRQMLQLCGGVDAVIMNGQIVMESKYIEDCVDGRNIYARFV